MLLSRTTKNQRNGFSNGAGKLKLDNRIEDFKIVYLLVFSVFVDQYQKNVIFVWELCVMGLSF